MTLSPDSIAMARSGDARQVANADQHIAAASLKLDELIPMWAEALAELADRSRALAAVGGEIAFRFGDHPHAVQLLLAVAVARLAELPDTPDGAA